MYNSFYVVVRNKANKRSVVGRDCGTLDFATLMAEAERRRTGREVWVREYEQDSVFGERKLLQEHAVA
jgi:hypothetical protein